MHILIHAFFLQASLALENAAEIDVRLGMTAGSAHSQRACSGRRPHKHSSVQGLYKTLLLSLRRLKIAWRITATISWEWDRGRWISWVVVTHVVLGHETGISRLTAASCSWRVLRKYPGTGSGLVHLWPESYFNVGYDAEIADIMHGRYRKPYITTVNLKMKSRKISKLLHHFQYTSLVHCFFDLCINTKECFSIEHNICLCLILSCILEVPAAHRSALFLAPGPPRFSFVSPSVLLIFEDFNKIRCTAAHLSVIPSAWL